MVDLRQLAGAYGSVTEDAAKVEARSLASRGLGAFGIDAQLQPYTPAPTTPPPPVGQGANLAKEDQQKPPSQLMAFVKQYQRVLLIAGGVAVALWLFAKRRGRK